jgi:hypothetical protein
VGIRPEQDLARADVPLLGQGLVADALVVGLGRVAVRVGHARLVLHELRVVVVRQALLLDEVAERLHVAVALLVGGEDVVVGDDDDPALVPDLGVPPELLVEDADGPGAAHVVRHEDVDVHPDVLVGVDAALPRVLGEDLLRHGHAGHRSNSWITRFAGNGGV